MAWIAIEDKGCINLFFADNILLVHTGVYIYIYIYIYINILYIYIYKYKIILNLL